jgi:two-component system, NarL family, response regulator LiaR
MHGLTPSLKSVPELTMLTLSPMKILVMDASPLMKLRLKQTLENPSQEHLLDFITSSSTSVNLIQNREPDLVMIDIDDINSDGLKTLQTLTSALPHLRVMVLSSDRRESQAVQAFLYGAHAYFVKSSSSKQLMVAIACIQDGAIYLDPHIARGVVKQLQTPVFNPLASILSKRELEILQLLVAGQTNVEMAKALYLSPHTIKSHVRSIMNKLAVDDRVQIAVTAFRSGLVRPHVA